MELFFSSSVMLFLHANSVKAFVKRYVQLLPCFPLLTHNACLTYSSFPECLPSPKIWFPMWRKENQGGAGTFHQTSILNGSPQWVERSQSSFQFHMRKPLREVRNEPFDLMLLIASSSHQIVMRVSSQWLITRSEDFRMHSEDPLQPTTTSLNRCKQLLGPGAIVLLQTITATVFTDIILANRSVSFPCELFLVSAF